MAAGADALATGMSTGGADASVSTDAQIDSAVSTLDNTLPGDQGTSDGAESQVDSIQSDTQTDTLDAGDQQVDGRTLPAKWRQAITAAKATDPKFAGELRRVYSRDQQFTQVFPQPADAMAAREALDAFEVLTETAPDGTVLQGVEAAHALINGLRAMDEQLASGDPALVEQLFENDPDGAAKLVPNAIAQLRASNPQAYQQVALNMIAEELEATGFIEKFNAMVDAFNGDKKQDAIAHGTALANWLGQAIQARQKAQQAPNPEVERLRKENEQLRNSGHDEFRSGIRQEALSVMNRGIETELNALLKGRNIPDSAKKRITQNIINDLGSILSKDSRFQQQNNAILASGNKEKALKFLQARLGREIPGIVRTVWSESGYAGMKAAPAKSGQQQAGPKTGTVVPKTGTAPQALNYRPSMAEIDMSRMVREFGSNAAKDKIFDRQVYLVGKPGLYTWRPGSPSKK